MLWLTVRSNEPRKNTAPIGIYKCGARMAYHNEVLPRPVPSFSCHKRFGCLRPFGARTNGFQRVPPQKTGPANHQYECHSNRPTLYDVSKEREGIGPSDETRCERLHRS